MRYVRRRYLAVRVEGSDTIDESELVKAVWGMIYQLFGEYGASQAGMSHIAFKNNRGITILRCSHNALDMTRTAIAAISEINKIQVVLRVVAVSGTLRALRRKIHQPRMK
ncbi:MAG: Rpp14/Pop5 family protein [Candidatus Bathyarchaeota archaeon]|nr:Rpp14/Pop5 family protein [Candidatus Bathyarchaeota archaeon]